MQGLTSQIYAFCVTVLTGFLLGIFFDMYRVLRGVIRPRGIITHLGDLLFWFISTGFIFLLLLFGNWGEIRFYVFVGVALGVMVYLRWFSRMTVRLLALLLKVMIFIKNFVAACLHYLIVILLFPFMVIKHTVFVPLGLIGTSLLAGKRYLAGLFRRWVGRPVKGGWVKFKRRLCKIFHKN